MIDAPIGPGADVFITLFILGASLLAGVLTIDVFKSMKSEEKEVEDQR